MPEVQEVFQMATQKVRPDANALERQHRDQRSHATMRKATVFALVGAIVIGTAVFGFSMLRSEGDETKIDIGNRPPPSPIPQSGSLEAGTYAVSTLAPDFGARYQVTIDVPEGYSAVQGWGLLKDGRLETSVSVWIVGDVYSDACDLNPALVDRSEIATPDGVATTIAGQGGFDVSTPEDTMLSGFRGTYMERTLPLANQERCQDVTRYPVWEDTEHGQRYLQNLGQQDLLWVLDVDGFPLVIDASLDAGASEEDRAEIQGMVDSIRIEPIGSAA